MRIRWFGESWGSALCEEYQQIGVPVDRVCIECTKPIVAKDRGVLTECSPRVWGGWDLVVDGNTIRVCCYHLSCWLRLVVGDHLSHEVLSRMPGRQDEIAAMLNRAGEESVDDVGGWRSPLEE